MSYPFLGLLPLFSSWLRTDAASFRASDGVGFFVPESTLLASVDILSLDCFFDIAKIRAIGRDSTDESIAAPNQPLVA